MSGVGTTDQVEPFHCSVSGEGSPLLPGSSTPTAQQSEPVTQVTSHNNEAVDPGTVAPGPEAHDVPFQCSNRAEGPPPPLRLANEPPTTQQFHEFEQVLPSSRLLFCWLTGAPVTMFQPEGVAALAVGTAKPTTSSPAATAPTSRLTRW